MRVVVCGGGIGGLALAQGLVRCGVEVVVLERDEDLAETGGYKLHLAPAPLRALCDLLPAGQMGELLARSVRTTGFTLAVRDHRARLLVRAREDEEGQSVDVDRITLRRALADGLGDRLRLGQQCVVLLFDSVGHDGVDLDAPATSWATLEDEDLLRRLPEVAAAGQQVETHLATWGDAARDRGISWARIGKALNMTRQSAWERSRGQSGQVPTIWPVRIGGGWRLDAVSEW